MAYTLDKKLVTFEEAAQWIFDTLQVKDTEKNKVKRLQRIRRVIQRAFMERRLPGAEHIPANSLKNSAILEAPEFFGWAAQIWPLLRSQVGIPKTATEQIMRLPPQSEFRLQMVFGQSANAPVVIYSTSEFKRIYRALWDADPATADDKSWRILSLLYGHEYLYPEQIKSKEAGRLNAADILIKAAAVADRYQVEALRVTHQTIRPDRTRDRRSLSMILQQTARLVKNGSDSLISPENIAKRGSSSTRALLIKELNSIVPKALKQRNAAIAALLMRAGVSATRQLVTSTLKKGRT